MPRKRELPIFTRGSYWYCYVRNIDGERRQRALHIRDDGSRESREAAEAAYWQEQARATNGQLDRPERQRQTLGKALLALAKQQSVADLSEHSHLATQRAAKHLLAHFGADFEVGHGNVKRADFVDYANVALKTRRPKTVHAELWVLCRGMEALELNPPKIPKLGSKKSKPQQPLTPDEQRRLLLAARPRRKLMFMTFLSLGIRCDEWNKLAEVNWTTRTIHIVGTKTTKSDRWVPIPDELWEMMDGMRRRGEWAGFEPTSRQVIDGIIRTTAERAGIGPRSANDLRGTHATNLALQGVSATERAALQGNSEEMQQRVYSQPHLRAEELRPAVDKMPRIQRPSPKSVWGTPVKKAGEEA